MVLKFPPSWRFRPPRGEKLHTDQIPDSAVHAFMGMIRKTATQGDLQDYLEHFKRFFCATNGNPHSRSSNAGWAETDLQTEMFTAAENTPLFIEAFYDACESIRSRPGDFFAPDHNMINEICREHSIGYEIIPPDLKLTGNIATIVPVPERPATLAEKAQEILQRSLQNAERLLSEGRGREAVQETLWLLETVATGFRGVDTGTGSIEGKYFNKIVKELRASYSGKTLDRALEWMVNLHGYLSSPTGGGVRHGLDLRDGLELSPIEAKLFFNLIRSYVSFLLSEHERLAH
jgi:hypothetical protein